MNAKKPERLLLLEQSGELSPAQRRALGQAGDVESTRRELKALCATIQSPDVEPDPWAITRIAARLRKEPRPVLLWARKPVLALAAIMVLAAGLWIFKGGQPSVSSFAVATAEVDVWNDPFETELQELEVLILAISEDSFDIMEM